MVSESGDGVETTGIFLLAFAGASLNLRVLGGPEVEELTRGVVPDGWYPEERFHAVIAAISRRYKDFEPAIERIGEELARSGLEQLEAALSATKGPGRHLFKRGVDFLRFQTGSEGYLSVVRGPQSKIGSFALEELDEVAGRARVRSTTPFSRSMERGVLIGGMRVTGDLVFIEVDNSRDHSVFEIRFR